MNRIARNAHVIPRPRLLHKLEEATRLKLTLISAPPGYGKSVLAAQFAEQTDQVVIWHGVEERERDLPFLNAQSQRAVKESLPEIALPPIPVNAPPNEIAANLADALRQAPREIIYVLDDAHHLEGSLGAEQWLQTLIDLLPTNSHLVLISRSVPDLPLVELLARHQVSSIGADDLRLTTSEICALAADGWGNSVSLELLEQIEQQTEGWPAGVALSFYPLPDELQHILRKGQSGPQTLFRALAGLMFEAQPPPLRNFLLSSSTLTYMSAELLDGALGLSNPMLHLADAQTRNLFIRRSPQGLSYHALFREFLQDELKQRNALKFIDLHLKAARWFEDENDPERAFTHYIAAERFSRAALMADEVADAFFVQGKYETLLAWKAVLQQTGSVLPKLLSSCAIIYIDRYQYSLAEAALNEIERLGNAVADPSLLAKVEINRALIDIWQGKKTGVVSRLTRLLDAWFDQDGVRANALYVLGYAHNEAGRPEEALRCFNEALPLFRQHMTAHGTAQLLQTLGVAHERLGNIAAASSCLQESISLLRIVGGQQKLAFALNNLGYYFFLVGNYEQAQHTYQDGLALLTKAPHRRTEGYLLWNLADLKRDTGDWRMARKLYNAALGLVGQDDVFLRCGLLISMSCLERWDSHYAEAIELAREAALLADASGLAVTCNVAQAALYAAQARTQGAADILSHLEAVIHLLRLQRAKIKLQWVLGMAAAVALAASRKAAARQYLREIEQLAGETDTAQPAAAEIVNSSTLLDFCNQPGSSPRLVRDIEILTRCRVQISAYVEPTLTLFSLRSVTLGQTAVLRDGQTISASAWRSSTARELFFYLLFNGPSQRDQIASEFWPEGSADQIRSNFHTALKRARHALGENVVTFSEDIYALNPDVALSCDALEMESLTTQARGLSPGDARAEDLLTRAVQLYGGEFLTDVSHQWAASHREKYYDLYLEGMIGLAACAKYRHDFKTALQLLKRVLKLEPYREDVHRLILQLHADRGEKRKVLTHYRTLWELLKNDLGLEPAGETRQLFQHLMD